jgi:hypothetical protein
VKVLAVGVAVDSCAHITHTFLDSDGTGNERATHALEVIGRSVLNGIISTMLVLVPLAWARSYIFQVFFKCFFSILGHSLWHGMFVLPVLLSLCKPQSFTQIRKKLGIVKGNKRYSESFGQGGSGAAAAAAATSELKSMERTHGDEGPTFLHTEV